MVLIVLFILIAGTFMEGSVCATDHHDARDVRRGT
jgi:hypothetical protein